MASTTSATPRKTTKPKSTSAGPRRSTSAAKSKTATKADPKKTPVEESKMDQASMPDDGATEVKAAADTAAGSTADGADDRLKRPDLIEAIAGRVSLKRSEAKMVFDVVLDEIGKALDGNDEVVIPPLGKLMVKKRDVKPGGPMLTLKLKRADAAPEAGDVPPLADPGEDS